MTAAQSTKQRSNSYPTEEYAYRRLLRTESQAVQVSTENGAVVGFVLNGTRVFRGIPYAAAPVGDNRFREPKKHEGWTSPLDATKDGASCIQLGSPQLGSRLGHEAAWSTLNLDSSSE